MISGFNSDIEFQGTVYHVQTEDKGLDTPIILSLVYTRGEILASKRSPYEDLIAAGFNEEELNERLQRQHKLIIAAIRAGRIEDLKRMTMKEAQKKRAAVSNESESPLELTVVDAVPRPKDPLPAVLATSAPDVPPIQQEQQLEIEAPVQVAPVQNEQPEPLELDTQEPVEEAPIAPKPAEVQEFQAVADVITSPSAVGNAPAIPRPHEELALEIPIDIIEEPFFDDAEIVEYGEPEETILPSEAVKIITEHVGVAEVDETQLKIRLLGRTTFMSGQEATLDILVAYGGKLGQGTGGAHIMVKVVGSSFKPQIFHTRADENGISQVHLTIPHISSGRAAILIKALYEGEEVELRHVIAQR